MSVSLRGNLLKIKDPDTGEYYGVSCYSAPGEILAWLNDHPEIVAESISPFTAQVECLNAQVDTLLYQLGRAAIVGNALVGTAIIG